MQVTYAYQKMKGGLFLKKPGKSSSNIFQRLQNFQIAKSVVPSARFWKEKERKTKPCIR